MVTKENGEKLERVISLKETLGAELNRIKREKEMGVPLEDSFESLLRVVEVLVGQIKDENPFGQISKVDPLKPRVGGFIPPEHH
ncbi:hypothetical protein HYU45_04965 [Candidatus Daviesbacteria bacterium]|nr:hypothetical protein [Candidatus Daviesbacteria bacterium]